MSASSQLLTSFCLDLAAMWCHLGILTVLDQWPLSDSTWWLYVYLMASWRCLTSDHFLTVPDGLINDNYRCSASHYTYQSTTSSVRKNFSFSQSVSQWNAWPATGRSALQDLRSCAILQASLALSPVSSSICCTHVRQGRPRWRFHSGLMSGLPPMRASTARHSADWAGVASGSRRTWPKMESRLRQIRTAKPSRQFG